MISSRRLWLSHADILERSRQHLQLASSQVGLCDQMKVAIDRHQTFTDTFLDETAQVLTNWTTPRAELRQKLVECMRAQSLESEKCSLFHAMQL